MHGAWRLAKLIKQAKENRRPCVHAPESRQFDFWLGEWSVTTTQGGIPAGDSKIELILEDCVVQENWKSQNGPYSGKSYNIYNQAQKRWEQYWVDNVGGNIFFYGGVQEGGLDLFTREITPTPAPTLNHPLPFIPHR